MSGRPVAEERATAARYAGLLAEHGVGWRALDWGSAEGQRRRFAQLAAVMPLAGLRVLDVGCGLAHLADWFDAHGIAVDYTGLDLTEAFVRTAATRHPARRFVHGSVVDPDVLADERFDVVLSSGIFFSYPEGGDAFLRAAVTRMWSWATRAVAFNSLSAWAPDREAGEYYADPAGVLAFCGTLTPRVALRHDYHPRDFTVHLHRLEGS